MEVKFFTVINERFDTTISKVVKELIKNYGGHSFNKFRNSLLSGIIESERRYYNPIVIAEDSIVEKNRLGDFKEVHHGNLYAISDGKLYRVTID